MVAILCQEKLDNYKDIFFKIYTFPSPIGSSIIYKQF